MHFILFILFALIWHVVLLFWSRDGESRLIFILELFVTQAQAHHSALFLPCFEHSPLVFNQSLDPAVAMPQTMSPLLIAPL